MIKRIEIIQGDITEMQVDAIVNAANKTLLGGGGVDGAIHRAAGKELLEECKQLNGCQTGEAKITKAYKLPAKYVIHTVGPVWGGGNYNEDILLEKCYLNSLKLAVSNDIRTIAFPAISTGVYKFPIERATEIAIKISLNFLSDHQQIKKIIFVCFSLTDKEIYENIFNQLIKYSKT